MSFSHKPRPGFELHSPWPVGRRLVRHGGDLRGFPHTLCVASRSAALLALLAGTTWAGLAAASPGSLREPITVAGASATGVTPGLDQEAAPSEAAAIQPEGDASTFGAYTDSASAAAGNAPPGLSRTRRRATRPVSAIRIGAAPGRAYTAPRDVSDVNAWIEYKARAHVVALPVEARIFYRRGVLASAEGRREEGERHVRAAAELDPSFVDPHLTIAAWSLPDRPSQALVHWAAVLDLARESFVFQAGLVANVLFLTFQSLGLALLIAGIMIVALRVPELSHPWHERLATVLRPATARWWALAFVVLPYLLGLGLVLPTIAFLGLLWPSLRARERTVFVLLTLGVAVTPWTAVLFDRLATPLDPGRAPLYGTAMLESAPWSPERQQRLANLAARDPDNPFLRFAHAWIARRGGDLVTAEREYRAALERWPDDDRVLTNLGNVLAMQGKSEEALELYQRASVLRPQSAAPHFNESQIYTQRFEYDAATQALTRASALDFDLVRDYQSLGTSDGVLALVDQWIPPGNFWLALGGEAAADLAGPAGSDAARAKPSPVSLPPPWRGHLETSGLPFVLLALGTALAAVVAGALGYRALPLRSCSNCGRVVCRRCAQRRRETALCRNCAALETRAQNADFARVLMRRSRRQAEKLRHGIRTGLSVLVPGFGLLSYRRAVTPLLLIAVTTMIIGPWAGTPLPFELEPRVALADRLLPLPLRIGILAVICAISILGYFSCASRERRAAALAAEYGTEPAKGAPRRAPARAA